MNVLTAGLCKQLSAKYSQLISSELVWLVLSFNGNTQQLRLTASGLFYRACFICRTYKLIYAAFCFTFRAFLSLAVHIRWCGGPDLARGPGAGPGAACDPAGALISVRTARGLSVCFDVWNDLGLRCVSTASSSKPDISLSCRHWLTYFRVQHCLVMRGKKTERQKLNNWCFDDSNSHSFD